MTSSALSQTVQELWHICPQAPTMSCKAGRAWSLVPAPTVSPPFPCFPLSLLLPELAKKALPQGLCTGSFSQVQPRSFLHFIRPFLVSLPKDTCPIQNITCCLLFLIELGTSSHFIVNLFLFGCLLPMSSLEAKLHESRNPVCSLLYFQRQDRGLQWGSHK